MLEALNLYLVIQHNRKELERVIRYQMSKEDLSYRDYREQRDIELALATNLQRMRIAAHRLSLN